MKKLRLEEILVESYVTEAVPAAKGTVRANEATTLCETAMPRCQQTLYSSCESAPWCC